MDDYIPLREEYYELRGWDVPTGLPSAPVLRSLELSDAADELGRLGLIVLVPRKTSLFKRIVRKVGRKVKRTADRGTGRGGPEGSSTPGVPIGSGKFGITGDELVKLLEKERAKYNHEAISHNFRGWNKTMLYYFTDTGEYCRIQMIDGEAQPPERLGSGNRGPIDGNGNPLQKPEILYQMDTETLRAMAYGELSGFDAYRQRRLKLRASFMDMMKLQSLNALNKENHD
jgi:hypothetical protein